MNFRNTPEFCISGYKYNACTGLPLQGWEIRVFNASTKALMGTATTDALGFWRVCGLVPGNYWANETLKGGWQNANPNQLVALGCENKTGVNFSNNPLLCLGGRKINNCTGEGISGWTIHVTNASGFSRDVATNDTGYWLLCGLSSGTYDVCEELYDMLNITPLCYSVDLGCTNNTSIDFRNVPSGLCINGYKINDCTGQGLNGWTVIVRDEAGREVGRDVTRYDVEVGNGYWSVCNLRPGKYQVCEVLQPGWTNVTPLCQNITLGCDGGERIDFRNTPELCISGYKYNACNGDPLQGWEIKVFNASTKALMGTATTDALGYWEVCHLLPGNYWANETLKAGWQNANPNQLVALLCVNKTNVNFRNTPELCISGYKYNACNGQPLSGWEIKVFNASTKALMGTATTDALGFWQVCHLVPGSYWANETLKAGWQNVNPNQLVALLCVNKTNVNFSNTPLLCLGGRKIDDCNGQGMSGWTIHVTNASGFSRDVATNGSGYWLLCGLSSGTYNVCEDLIND
ncbi:MAG: hypothetical protein NTU95_11525 [Methanothrix sp.]|nr:hypothetical protein [Methanothrix sp.]